ncbi:hypothetical protein NKR19_g8477 [Coniochaeta hoffmannii]|uniref:Uncharacterized protein n=1 Tax=Coniochaeta hoffmannii TaxID=91930 RepID=A0AA38R5C1_9PEZI|nr:hypothetical protein NKR19_g8477 [Coniochaeta hoffmannii]
MQLSQESGGWIHAARMPVAEIPHAGVPGVYKRSVMSICGEDGHLSFSPLFPSDGVGLQERFERAQVGVVLVVFMPKTEGERARRFHKVLLDDAERTGIPEYRTHIGHMDWSRRKFDFNDHALGRTLSSIKGLLDPAGILLQGKSSIWTEHAIVKAGF